MRFKAGSAANIAIGLVLTSVLAPLVAVATSKEISFDNGLYVVTIMIVGSITAAGFWGFALRVMDSYRT